MRVFSPTLAPAVAFVLFATQALAAPVYGYKVVRTYPHSTQSYTEGFFYLNGLFYEGTGLAGHSALLAIQPETGKVVQEEDLGAKYFGEGIVDAGPNILQWTWQSHTGFVIDRFSFRVIRQFSYTGEGWGMTRVGNEIVTSDGSSVLRFRDPNTFAETRHITVREGLTSVDQLNELEYVKGEIYANVWHTDRIVRISPKNGKVLGWIDLHGILPDGQRLNGESVLNGIAYDAKGDRLFVTGKQWPTIFEIKLVPPEISIGTRMSGRRQGGISGGMVEPSFKLVGPAQNVEIFGVRLLGFDAQNGRKLLLTVAFLLVLYLISKGLRALAHAEWSRAGRRVTFWTRQGISLVTFTLALLGVVSIWFDNPARLATGLGLVGAGLAFALQKVITSFAGYFVILRGKTFNVGDRITMGGVRGDVIALNFMQTVIMEMGQPPSVQASDPGMWVQSRQYSGRIVTVTNAKIFEEPVYNYTRDFPYIWEEIHLPVSYKDDRRVVEQILLRAAQKETVQIADMAESAIQLLQQRFLVDPANLKPQVYVRLTDNWVEMTVRFLCKDHDIRSLKDRMSREIIDHLDAAKIGIASSTYDVVGMPPLRVQLESANGGGQG